MPTLNVPSFPRELQAASFGRLVLLSAALVMPLVVLEIANGGEHEFPFALFGFQWALVFAILALARALFSTTAQSAFRRIALAVALVAAVAATASLVADQMPCFLGVPNCD